VLPKAEPVTTKVTSRSGTLVEDTSGAFTQVHPSIAVLLTWVGVLHHIRQMVVNCVVNGCDK
jgi:hypothetical protein